MQGNDGLVAGLSAALGALLIKLADKMAERWMARPDRIKALEDGLWERAGQTIAALDARIAGQDRRIARLEESNAEKDRRLDAQHAEIVALQDMACEVEPCEQRRRPGK